MSTWLRDSLLAAALAVALTLLATWPMAARFGTAGRIDSGDGRFSIWNVAWVAHALTTDPRSLYDANIFYPFPNALAFSDPNLLAGVIAIPIWITTHNAMAASNWVIAWSFVLSFLCTFWLVRYLTRSRSAGALSAILFAVSPYVFSHLPHVQLLMTFGMPLSLLAMHRFVAVPGPARAVQLGLALALQALGCGYYGIFGGLAVGWGVLWFGVVGRHWRDWRYWAGAVLAAAVTAAVVAPFLAPVAAIQREGFGRTLDDARLFAAVWQDYLASPMLLHEWMLPWLGGWREILFPGFLATTLAAVAVVQSVKPRPVVSAAIPAAVVWFYVSLAILAAWASFGPDAGLYRVMYDVLPFFSLIRASARFGVLVTLAVGVLAGLGLVALAPHAGEFRRRLVVGLMLVLALARSTVGPLALIDQPPPHEVYVRLQQLPPGAVVEFPYFFTAVDRHRHTEYMLASTTHWKPLINGYSDHTPAQAFDDMATLATFPRPEAWTALKRRRARYVVMHWDKYAPALAPHREIRTYWVGRHLRRIVDRDDMSLFEIVSWPE